MKIAFMGSSEFAVASLNGLLHSTHEVLLVVTQPDKPAGRGQKITP
ncbi:MAG: methionyl-tRNA formyltransferase, partial [Deltaproteobacteria bacterium]|nr:methionyl-tRNA formyltransferase [Deltaproteobacteria bacterium]